MLVRTALLLPVFPKIMISLYVRRFPRVCDVDPCVFLVPNKALLFAARLLLSTADPVFRSVYMSQSWSMSFSRVERVVQSFWCSSSSILSRVRSKRR